MTDASFEDDMTDEQVEEFMAEFRRLNVRPASILEVGGFRPTGDPLASNMALLPVMKPGEKWPHDNQNLPMQFIAQLNLTEAPYVPELLQDIALLTIFVGSRCIEEEFVRGSWELRSYGTLDGLELVAAAPRPWHWLKGFECRWKEILDYPCYDDNLMRLPAGYNLEDDLPEEIHGLNIKRSKVGGFASTIQHAVGFQALTEHSDETVNFVLQIDSEEKSRLMWADNGTLYIGRRLGTDQWFASCQFY